MQVKIKNIVVHNKLELIKVLRSSTGYTLDNCMKLATQVNDKNTIELDEHIIHSLSKTDSITFDVDWPVYDTYSYQDNLDYIDAKNWYDLLPEKQKQFVQSMARDFSVGPTS